jgi:surface antigen
VVSGSSAARHAKVLRGGPIAKPRNVPVAFGGRGNGGDGAPQPGDDYPTQWRAPVPQDSLVDSWGEYNRECTSFVAWALHSRNHFDMPFNDDAKGWGNNARDRHFAVDDTPAVGAVAWAPHGDHVAWVAEVSGHSVTIEEYNRNYDGVYSWRVVDSSAFQYIHFQDLAGPTGSSGSGQTTGHGDSQVSGSNLQGGSPDLQSDSTINLQSGPIHVQGPAGGSGGGSRPGGSGIVSKAPTPTTPTPAGPQPRTYTEQSGTHGSPTFQNYVNASGQGPTIQPMTYVEISCKVRPSSTIASASSDGFWYRVSSAPWNNQYFAVANTFWNGDTPGVTPYTHNTDFNVPDC